MTDLTARQRQVLEFIDAEVRRRGYPPSVREIGEAVGLSSSSTVHAHLAALQDKGYLVRDPTKPRAIEVRFEPAPGQDRPQARQRGDGRARLRPRRRPRLRESGDRSPHGLTPPLTRRGRGTGRTRRNTARPTPG